MTKSRWLAGLVLSGLCAGHPAAQSRPAVPSRPPAECEPGTVCSDYDAASHVFLARVTQVTPPPDDRTAGPLLLQNVSFEVLEDFKNTAGGAINLTFNSEAPDARLFTAGETVVVYAKRVGADRALAFAGCSRTRRVTLDEPELAVLRELQLGGRGGSLEGTLDIPESARPPSLPRGANLANVPVTLQSMEEAETVTVVTQPSGYFLFPWLKPGRYRFRLDTPALAPILREVLIGERSRCQTLSGIAARPR